MKSSDIRMPHNWSKSISLSVTPSSFIQGEYNKLSKTDYRKNIWRREFEKYLFPLNNTQRFQGNNFQASKYKLCIKICRSRVRTSRFVHVEVCLHHLVNWVTMSTIFESTEFKSILPVQNGSYYREPRTLSQSAPVVIFIYEYDFYVFI